LEETLLMERRLIEDRRLGGLGMTTALRIARKLLVRVGIIVGILVFLLLLYISFNIPRGHKYIKLPVSELQSYASYIQNNVSDPCEFISRQFEKHDIVLIGEPHRRLQDVEFIKSLIPYICKKNKIRVIAWEFGASSHQADVDSLVTASEFDERKAISLMRRWSYYWNFKEYLDIYRLIWNLNREIPPGQEKIRFLQLDQLVSYRQLYSADPQERQKALLSLENRDRNMSEVFDQEVMQKGKKALWYSGLTHAFTRYRQHLAFFMTKKGKERRAGNFLFDKYGNRLYMVALHQTVKNRLGLFFVKSSYWYYPFGGVIDKVYENVRRPFAFDASTSSFGELKDKYSEYSLDLWGGLKLKEFCDGYVVTCTPS
jgi:hypothetical protein